MSYERDLCIKAHEAMGWSLKPCYFGPKGGLKRWAKPNSHEGVYRDLRSIKSNEFITDAIEFCREQGIDIFVSGVMAGGIGKVMFESHDNDDGTIFATLDSSYDLGHCLAQTLVKWKERQEGEGYK